MNIFALKNIVRSSLFIYVFKLILSYQIKEIDFAGLAEWLGGWLQTSIYRFESGARLLFSGDVL